MIKQLIIFDLDGVLVSTKNIHFESLNKSLPDKYKISVSDHIDRYDGLPTIKKLKLLTKEKSLPIELYDQINKQKQEFTFDLIRSSIIKDKRLKNILKQLKKDGFKIYVASNAIRETVKLLLYYTGLIEYVDYFISNQDIINPKPNPEIYLRCMIHAGVSPSETLIIEDSPRGIESASKSGANVLIVDCPESVTYDKIITEIMNLPTGVNKLKLSNVNILIPMAGFGSRFEDAGYTFPKPLIEIFGKPMIQLVVENLNIDANYIYVVRKDHYDKYNLKNLLNLITPNCKIIQVDKVTKGAACTTLLAKDYINTCDPLIIANSDQIVEWNPADFYYKMIETKADGGILTFTGIHSKWSFAKLDNNENVIEVAEKNPISNIATAGIYYFKKGSDYVKYAEQMINKNIRTNREFYLCPVFNEFILDNKKIKTYHINVMNGIGTPEDLDFFITSYERG
jgi:HAD superfamily hydrolase (TIGR01509 family)